MAVKERIAGIRADEIGHPVGAYRVELFDHRGRVTERVDRANYITPVHKRSAAYWNARIFNDGFTGLRLPHLGAAPSSLPDTPRVIYYPPALPLEMIIGTTSTLAADESSAWATGRVVGYASRWKSANVAAAGLRGQINEAQSEATLFAQKLVYDFNENQGNGEIGSLLIGRCTGHNQGTVRLGCQVGGTYTQENAAAFGPFRRLGKWDPAAGVAYTLANPTGSSTPVVVEEWDISSVTVGADGVLDVSGVTLTSTSSTLSSLTVTNSTASNAVTDPVTIEKYAGDYLVAFTASDGDLHLRRYTPTGTLVWASSGVPASGTGSSLGGSPAGVAVVGTDAYITAGPVSSFRGCSADIFRVRLSDGVVTATLPHGNDIEGNPIYSQGGICTDGTDLYVYTTEGIVKMATDGTVIEWLGDHSVPEYTDTGVSPWITTTNGYRTYNPNASRHAGATYTAVGSYATRLLSYSGGELYTRAASEQNSYVQKVEGWNCYSRAVLDTPVTKTASSTMKWTYEITFPDSWISAGTTDEWVHPLPI